MRSEQSQFQQIASELKSKRSQRREKLGFRKTRRKKKGRVVIPCIFQCYKRPRQSSQIFPSFLLFSLILFFLFNFPFRIIAEEETDRTLVVADPRGSTTIRILGRKLKRCFCFVLELIFELFTF